MNNIILVIDDNVGIRENTSELLSLAGYEIHTAKDGIEGLELARKINPDLILCDVMMPELDGYGVLRALGNVKGLNNVPFVFLTAKTERNDFRKGMDLGADDYLTKPFDGDELLSVIEARLKKSRMLQTKFENTFEGLNSFMAEVCSLNEIQELSINRDLKKFRLREYVYMEGDSANMLYFVSSGKIKIYQSNEWGKEYITAIHNPGDFFGYQALLEGNGHSNSAMTMESSEIVMIPSADFFNLLHSSHEVALKFIRYISNNAFETEKKLVKLAYDSARKKVAEALLMIYSKYNTEKKDVLFPAQRENISAIAGVSPESTSRNLADFRDEKLIITNNGLIRILDFEKLERLRA